MHWSDVMAQRLASAGKSHIVATGITPSGEFHIGHLREILTGDMIARAARRAGMDAELVFVVDNADPLRRCTLSSTRPTKISSVINSVQSPAPDKDGKPDWKRYNEEVGRTETISLLPFLEALKLIESRHVCSRILRLTRAENSATLHGLLATSLTPCEKS